MSEKERARCPKCKTWSITKTATPHAFYCHNCKMEFDETGDDGDIGRGGPSKRMERQENFKQKVKTGLLDLQNALYRRGFKGRR